LTELRAADMGLADQREGEVPITATNNRTQGLLLFASYLQHRLEVRRGVTASGGDY